MSQETFLSSHADAEPLVSVAITSFQSEKWICSAIQSVLNQVADFQIEIVVGDDCSSDGTVAAARRLQAAHPGIIRVLQREARLGMQRNFFETFESCRGRYIAWLDADDYWTDPGKLAAQVKALEADHTLSVCAHFVRMVTASGAVMRQRVPSRAPGRYGLADIVRRNFLPSASLLFRNGLQRNLPPAYFSLPRVADWALLVEGALVGDLLLLEGVMADYRRTPGSAYSSIDALQREGFDLSFYDYLASRLPTAYLGLLNQGRAETFLNLAYELRCQNDLHGSRRAALQAMRLGGMHVWPRAWRSLLGTFVAGSRGGIGGASRDSALPL